MILPAIRHEIEQIIGHQIDRVLPLHGGDISDAFRLDINQAHFFLKQNRASIAPKMFKAENKGLTLLRQCEPLSIPEIFAVGEHFILMEYIEPQSISPSFWDVFAFALATMHKYSQMSFGLDHPNFIGTLRQNNQPLETWSDFYYQRRLKPQLILGLEKGLFDQQDTLDLEKLASKLMNICPDENPSLCHGDLWSGNFISGRNNTCYLIDPAVSYMHREMDLAMSKLFGGFDPQFYRVYHLHYPLEPGWESRMDIYQLYYLMVHVNLFGSSYLGSVRRILRKYV